MYTAVDLFAGAGGLSLGFMQTGKYDIKVAFENSPYMQDTYRLNHPGVEVLGDVCSANYSDIMRKYGAIDVVIGGPPCQGFSNANRQKNHAISQNNMLVKQYLRAILELQPKAFVMENVSMLSSEVHRFYMEKRDEETIERCNIPVKDTLLHLLDAKFMYGCRGINLDYIARELLWRNGLDFNHGTGHGVGYLGCVHERPNSIRWRLLTSPAENAVLEEGMVTSDEPGLYLEGKFGIRTENLMLCVKDVKNEFGQFMKFENLTWVPIDLDTIDVSLMEGRDRELLNAYHKGVFKKLSPYMTEEEKVWLAEATRAI